MTEINRVLGCAVSAVLPFVGGSIGVIFEPSPDGFARGFAVGAGLGLSIQALGQVHLPKEDTPLQINKKGFYAIEQAKKKDLKTSGLNQRKEKLIIWHARLEVQKEEEVKKRNMIEESYIVNAKTVAQSTGKPKEETRWKQYFDKPGFEKTAARHIKKIQELDQEINMITGAIEDIEREIKAIEKKYDELLELAALRASLTIRGGDIPPDDIKNQLRFVGGQIKVIEDFFANP